MTGSFHRLRAILTVGCAVALAVSVSLAHAAADPNKVLRWYFPTAETGFDPAKISDLYSATINEAIFERLLSYDYMANPAKLAPSVAEAMPEVADNGRTYTFHLRKGVYFADDPAFKGVKRELTAQDFVYSYLRFADPKNRAPYAFLVAGKFEGVDELAAAAEKSGRFDYDAKVRGIEAVDRYTLRLRLKEPDYGLSYVLAHEPTSAVAREVVEAYGNDIGAHPVGTGPYMLGQYKRSSQIELIANPGFRDVTYVPAGPIPAASQAVAERLRGKRLPRTPRIDIRIIEEGQGQWLAFLNREIDILELLPPEFTPQALTDGKLKPDLAAKGIVHQVLIRPNVAFTYFNMDDPVVGGYTPEKIALRRAVSMAYNMDEAIRVLYYGRAHPANGPIPPDIEGFDPTLRTQAQLYDPAAARALLDKYGYKDRDGDGFREQPDGKPLTLERWSSPGSAQRQADELWKKNMNAIGLRIEFKKDKLPELRKLARQGKIPMRGDGWNGDYPDAENFMQLLYGPNAGQANYARFNLPEFNKLYDEARALPDSPARTKLFSKMTELVVAYAPWRLTINDMEDTFAHPWARDYVPHPIRSQVWAYIDVDAAALAKAR